MKDFFMGIVQTWLLFFCCGGGVGGGVGVGVGVVVVGCCCCSFKSCDVVCACVSRWKSKQLWILEVSRNMLFFPKRSLGLFLTQQKDAPVPLSLTKIFRNASEMADATTTSPAPTGSASRGGG